MTKTIKAYYIDPTTNTAESREITPCLDTYYEMLHCDTIDIVNRGFTNSKRRFDIICDDNGTFVDDVRISALNDALQPMLVGALLVVGQADEEGYETSLTDEDIKFLQKNAMHFGTRKHPIGWKMLTHMTY